MSFSLTRVEAPGEEWEGERNEPKITPALPAVLGRGSLLRCGEKTVSRRHAYVDWDDDGIMLTSVHQNPTYVLVKGNLKELTEGDALTLSHGDKFGLLKDRFWYMVNLPGNCKEEKNEAEKKMEEGVQEEKSHLLKPDTDDSTSDVKSKENKNEMKDDVSSIVEDSEKYTNFNGKTATPSDGEITSSNRQDQIGKSEADGDVTSKIDGKDVSSVRAESKKSNDTGVTPVTISAKELQLAVSNKKRDLPVWLKNAEILKKPPPGKEDQVKMSHGGTAKTQKAPRKQKANVSTAKFKKEEENANMKIDNKTPQKDNVKDDISPKKTPEKNHAKGDISPKKRSPANPSLLKGSPAKPSPKKASPAKKKCSPIKNNVKGLHTMSDEESENDSGNEPDEVRVLLSVVSDEDDEGSSNKPSQPTSLTNTPGGSTSPDSKKKKQRYPCQYGENCYRKNPKHLADYSHIGDSDYYENSSDPEGSDDERPQCEYGVTCYRKNPQHRKDYRHSRVPQPQRRAKRKARAQKQRDDSGSDDYDYDDPFLNDGSSDDYAPTDSDSDSPVEEVQEDDVKRMLKEGKKFVKKRR